MPDRSPTDRPHPPASDPPSPQRRPADRPHAPASDPPSPQRRAALGTLGRTLGALAAGCAALPAAGCIGAIVDPDAVTEMPLSEVPQGRKNILHAGRRVELLRQGGDVTARLLICTHEFCDLFWYDAEGNYRCTCHDGRFLADGRPRSGPVSKPMFELPTRIEGGTLFVGPAGELTVTG